MPDKNVFFATLHQRAVVFLKVIEADQMQTQNGQERTRAGLQVRCAQAAFSSPHPYRAMSPSTSRVPESIAERNDSMSVTGVRSPTLTVQLPHPRCRNKVQDRATRSPHAPIALISGESNG